tara:strand:- start:255 stop:626 length:372 start_codon:yes stop_codon:yes gene_type:complete
MNWGEEPSSQILAQARSNPFKRGSGIDSINESPILPFEEGFRGRKPLFFGNSNIPSFKIEASINCTSHQSVSHMAAVEGFCLKCKTYGSIKDGQLIKMKNGRTRMAGYCSQPGCTGKISKIVS